MRAGELFATVDGEEIVVRSGEELVIEPGQSHAMAASGTAPAQVTWQTMPARSTEQWWRKLDALARRHDGTPPLPATARLLREHGDVFELDMPRPVARVLLAVLSRLPVR